MDERRRTGQRLLFFGVFVSRTKYHKIVRDRLYPEHTTYDV